MSPIVHAQTVLITAPATVAATQTSITPTGGGPAVPLATADIIVDGTTLTMNGRHAIQSLVIQNVGFLSHDAGAIHLYSGAIEPVEGLELTVSAGVLVDASSAINVDGRGYPAATGPGAGGGGVCEFFAGGRSAAGGGHGGAGGASNGDGGPNGSGCYDGGATYDSYEFPTRFGSGGGGAFGAGGAGGGRVQIIASGAVAIDGTVTAKGGNAPGGAGGAGGTIWLEGASVTINGGLDASGGLGSPGGLPGAPGSGGGGRVRLDAGTVSTPGTVVLCGGTRNRDGGAGTLLIDEAGVSTLVVDNCGNSAGTTGEATGGTTDFDEPIRVDYMRVTGSARVSAKPRRRLVIAVNVDLTVDMDASIWVTGRGYRQGTGPFPHGPGAFSGAGVLVPCGLPSAMGASGGGHGGTGGPTYESSGVCADGGVSYGRANYPTTLGSGGSGSLVDDIGKGGAGGGAVAIFVGGHFQLDGTVDASGQPVDQAAGGAGGSILVSADTIGTVGTGPGSGIGITDVRGGDAGPCAVGKCTGGGAGGRVVLHTRQITGSLLYNISAGWPSSGTNSPHNGSVVYNPGQEVGAVFPLGEGGCDGTLGGPPRLQVSPPVEGGGTMQFHLSWAALGAPLGIVVLGLDNTFAPGFGPLPLDLSSLQMSGCTMYHDIFSSLFIPQLAVSYNGQGTAQEGTLSFNHPAASGLTLYATAAVLDPGANPLGIVLSNSFEIVFR